MLELSVEVDISICELEIDVSKHDVVKGIGCTYLLYSQHMLSYLLMDSLEYRVTLAMGQILQYSVHREESLESIYFDQISSDKVPSAVTECRVLYKI